MSNANVICRKLRNARGEFHVERSVFCTHAEVAAELRAAGLRLPTSDEWEFACGAGAPTLFRWGDPIPCDRYPTDTSPGWARYLTYGINSIERTAEQESEAEGAGGHDSQGDVADLSATGPSDGAAFEFHRDPNAFGLYIASDPYDRELAAEPDRWLGGDEGGTICGGMGFFVGWLPLATAYYDPYASERDPAEPIRAGQILRRRVLELG